MSLKARLSTIENLVAGAHPRRDYSAEILAALCESEIAPYISAALEPKLSAYLSPGGENIDLKLEIKAGEVSRTFLQEAVLPVGALLPEVADHLSRGAQQLVAQFHRQVDAREAFLIAQELHLQTERAAALAGAEIEKLTRLLADD